MQQANGGKTSLADLNGNPIGYACSRELALLVASATPIVKPKQQIIPSANPKDIPSIL